MNKFKFYFILLFISASLFSCKKDDDDVATVPPKDRAEQYQVDIDSIEGYLKTHYLEKVEVNGLVDVVIKKLPTDGSKVSIWANTEFPLKSKIVKTDARKTNYVDGVSDDVVEYKLYYLILNEGAVAGKRPTTVDSTYVTYRGWKLDNDEFDKTNIPGWSTYPAMSQAEAQISYIPGFRLFLPELKSADGNVVNPDGTVSFNNSGVGVVFIPSGLGYFNSVTVGIPAYSPLVFTVRLHAVRYRDHDRDGILSKDEDLNNDKNFFNDDTDGDNTPNFLDADDDGDGYSTKRELRRPAVPNPTKPGEFLPFTFYPYNGALVDDPSTPDIDETQGVPNCAGDFTSPTRLRKYLDPSCN